MDNIVCIGDKQRKFILDLYNTGYSQTSISLKTGIPLKAVRICIKNDTGKYSEYKHKHITKKVYTPTKNDKLRHEIITKYNEGVSIEDIAILENLTPTIVESYLIGAEIIHNDLYENAPINIDIINKFKKNLKIGDICYVFKNRYSPDSRYYSTPEAVGKSLVQVSVLSKFPNIVETDKGDFTYIDLLIGNIRHQKIVEAYNKKKKELISDESTSK